MEAALRAADEGGAHRFVDCAPETPLERWSLDVEDALELAEQTNMWAFAARSACAAWAGLGLPALLAGLVAWALL